REIAWGRLATCPTAAIPSEALSGLGLVLYGLTVTFAAIDWIMSLEPHWQSTIFGALLATAQVLSAFAWAIAALAWLYMQEAVGSRPEAEKISATAPCPLPPASCPPVQAEIWNHLGNLLLAFVILWTYM